MEFPDLDSINYAASVQELHNEFTRWSFLILIPPTMQQVFKSYTMSSQDGVS